MSADLARRLRLKDLHLLRAVDTHRSLSKAAAELGITQPAVTKALKDLEFLIGQPLFSRTTRALAPTEMGTFLMGCAAPLLAEIDLLARRIDAYRTGASGQRKLGVIPYAAPFLMPATLKLAMERAPAMAFSVTEETTETLLAHLREGMLDLVLARHCSLPPGSQLSLRAVHQEAGVVVAGRAHRLAKARGLAVADLLDEEWIMPPLNSPTRLAMEHAFVRAGLQPPAARLETYSSSVLINLLHVTGMLAILPEAVSRAQEGFGIVAILDCDLACDLPPLCVYRRERAMPDDALDLVEQAIFDAARSASAGRAAGNP
ncbi:LysR family transcriptional regulator [Xanthobacter sp. KR7-225]|uniref:LysR family transcriptional regulator n=1 Tax=Xanthobacter sp. KR7-225 TaxID=3156613 RepID=UPI0032B3B863